MSDDKKHDLDFGPVEPPPKAGFWSWLRGRFFAGMVIAAPVAITFWILQFLISEIDSRVVPLLPDAIKPETYLDYAVPGFGLIVTVVFVTLLGAITANLLGRSLITASDRLISRVPFVNTVYSAFKQLMEVFASKNSDQFSEVVMVQYPREGTWCVGFLSSTAQGEVKTRLGDDFVGVFVPTSPNPTSGFLIYVKRDECISMDMTVEEGAKLILSAGLVVPEHPPVPVTNGKSKNDPASVTR